MKKDFYTLQTVEDFLISQHIKFDEVKPFICSNSQFEIKLNKKVVKVLYVSNSKFEVYTLNLEAHKQVLDKVVSKQWVEFVKNSLKKEAQNEYYEVLKQDVISSLKAVNSSYVKEKEKLQKMLDVARKQHKRAVQVKGEELAFLSGLFDNSEASCKAEVAKESYFLAEKI